MNRRSFVKRGLVGGILLAAFGGVGISLWPRALGIRPRRRLRCLDTTEFAILAAVAARTVVAPNADAAEIAHGVDALMALEFPESQRDFRRLLRLFNNPITQLLLDGRLRRFSDLSDAEKDVELEAWRDSRLALRRGGYNALRKLTLSAYYASPGGWQGLHYPGPPSIGG